MNSRLFALLLALWCGCAAFERGEYWDADTDAAPGDASGPSAGSTDPKPGETGEPETSEGSATTGEPPETTGDASTGIATGPSFGVDILPVLRAGCERCHTAAGAASTTSFLLDVDDDTAYATTLDFVDLDNPPASRLLAKTAGQGHTGGVIYDDRSAEYDAILRWIEHGALP
jgi:hypothetical protein